MEKIGVIHGRFQGLHLGHMEYLLEGKMRCKFLLIGISNPDSELTKENVVDIKRSKPEENPFTYYERMVMIRDAMIDSGVARDEFDIVPFPINFPDLLKNYVPLDALFFVTIYDEWGRFKLNTLKSIGIRTDVMWTRSMEERFTTGKEIRRLISEDQPWEHLVPPSVSSFIKDNNLIKRVKLLRNETI